MVLKMYLDPVVKYKKCPLLERKCVLSFRAEHVCWTVGKLKVKLSFSLFAAYMLQRILQDTGAHTFFWQRSPPQKKHFQTTYLSAYQSDRQTDY